MRLINVHTMFLEEFTDEEVVEYAILSHRWGADEVSFQDMQSDSVPLPQHRYARKAGFAKIRQGCAQAAQDGHRYFWCDTCCINKESTSELSEAINSMYRWYRQSKACYVFMSDVDSAYRDPLRPNGVGGEPQPRDEHPGWPAREGTFGASAWFTRGWTLQELIAPRRVEFFDRHWVYLGSRDFLLDPISRVTGISRDVLGGGGGGGGGATDEALARCSVAQRMSWASGRTTTRVEDMAYCLLGIFDVNMPMLYGEGRRAFVRLQEEILRQSDDHSIFAWAMARREAAGPNASLFSGLLAPAPTAFASCRDVREFAVRDREAFAMTNRGLAVTLFARPYTTHTYLALLNCSRQGAAQTGERNPLAILIQRMEEDDQFLRVAHRGQSFMEVYVSPQAWDFEERLRRLNFKPVKFHVRQRVLSRRRGPVADAFRVSLRTRHADLKSQLVPFDTTNFTSSVEIGFTTTALPITRLRLALDHDMGVLCFMELCSELRFHANERTIKSSPMKHYSLLAYFPMSVLDGLPQWTTSGEGETQHADHGLWVFKGDRQGFNVSVSSFGKLRLFTTPWWDENMEITWHLDIQLEDSVSPAGVSFWAVEARAGR